MNSLFFSTLSFDSQELVPGFFVIDWAVPSVFYLFEPEATKKRCKLTFVSVKTNLECLNDLDLRRAVFTPHPVQHI